MNTGLVLDNTWENTLIRERILIDAVPEDITTVINEAYDACFGRVIDSNLVRGACLKFSVMMRDSLPFYGHSNYSEYQMNTPADDQRKAKASEDKFLLEYFMLLRENEVTPLSVLAKRRLLLCHTQEFAIKEALDPNSWDVYYTAMIDGKPFYGDFGFDFGLDDPDPDDLTFRKHTVLAKRFDDCYGIVDPIEGIDRKMSYRKNVMSLEDFTRYFKKVKLVENV